MIWPLAKKTVLYGNHVFLQMISFLNFFLQILRSTSMGLAVAQRVVAMEDVFAIDFNHLAHCKEDVAVKV